MQYGALTKLSLLEMHRKMMMINGKQLPHPVYKLQQLQTSNFETFENRTLHLQQLNRFPISGTEDNLGAVLPPQRTNPSIKGVPILWTNIGDKHGKIAKVFVCIAYK